MCQIEFSHTDLKCFLMLTRLHSTVELTPLGPGVVHKQCWICNTLHNIITFAVAK